MNNKGQIEPIPFIMAIAGIAIAWFMAGRMDAGFVYKLVTALLTGVACYFLAYAISNA